MFIRILTLCLVALAFSSVGSGESDIALSKARLAGTFKLVSAQDTTDSGQVRDSYGPGATGFLTYTSDGRMMAIISNGGRKPLSVADRVGAPERERAEAFATFIAYAGTYSIEGDRVIHHVEISSVQNAVNTDFVRTVVSFSGDRLVLRTPPLTRGALRVTHEELVWERVKPGASQQ